MLITDTHYCIDTKHILVLYNLLDITHTCSLLCTASHLQYINLLMYFLGSPVVYPEPDIQDTDIEESIARLLELDPMLFTLNLNNHPGLEEPLFQQLCDALVSNTYLTSLQLAGTGLGDNQAKVKFY